MGKISIIVPVWNEEVNVTPLVKRIHSSLRKHKIDYEIICIDDHSSDNTIAMLKILSKKYPISVYGKKGTKGKAFSIMEGLSYARFNMVAMIDADLQYPPEALPAMIKKIKNGADIVIANRIQTNTSIVRTVVSSTFRLLFGRLLFGLPYDIQAGLKVFRKKSIKLLHITPRSSWTLDLELLHKAKKAGFNFDSVDILFTRRKFGSSKVSLLKTSVEIGINALQVKFREITPIRIHPSEKNTMLGAGIRYNGISYLTHSTLHPSQSAIQTIIPKQKWTVLLSAGVLGIILIFRPIPVLQVLVGILSFIYFADVLFNLFLILMSLHNPQEITYSAHELASVDNSSLPVYSILCPLYKEAHMIRQFIDSISKLEYPRNKLDVMLLLEKDDGKSIETVKKMTMPSFVRVLIVPHSLPKTKPKACNYGLAHAKGEYLVIYDAEDVPDPLQLKKAYLGFQKVGDKIFCLQAKLNYYNPNQNLLTRFFTAEYSLWFEITLTGLQSVKSAIPLGGTSNHFKTANLRKLEGWDPFNVTEDADLGIRLFKQGFSTAIIDSVTLEEANSDWGNWLRQRSRWIKGYMQTYLVHSRDNIALIKKTKWHALIFHLVIGGKIAFILINPILWILTILYFTLFAFIGPMIDKVYPPVILYMAITSLVFGNSLFFFYYMIGVAKKEQWELIKFIFLVPLYWGMISIAGIMALYQLISNPHYWEKTVHGLHVQKPISELIIEIEQVPSGFRLPAPIKNALAKLTSLRKLYTPGDDGKNNQ